MPFDGTGFSENPALQKLDAVLTLLASEDKWCKGAFRSPDGRRCLMGAIEAADARDVLEPVVSRAIEEVTGRWFWRIEHFNDHRRTTHALVLRVLHRAREQVVVGDIATRDTQRHIRPVFKPLAAWLARHAGVGGAA